MNLGRGAKAVLILAAFVVLFAGIKLAADLLVPLFLAGFLAAVTAPLVLWLCDRGLPRGLAVTIALFLDVSALVGLGALIGTSLNAFYEHVPRYQEQLTLAVTDTTSWLTRWGVQQEAMSEVVNVSSAMGLVGTLLKSIAGMLSNLVLVLLIVVFMLVEATGLRTKLSRVFPGDPSRLQRASRDITKYLLVKTGTSALTGILVGLWLAAWGVDLPILWGLLAFLLSYIPTLGAIVAGVPILLLSWLELGGGATLGVASGYLLINLAIGSFLEPRIFGRALGLSPLVVFLSMVFWGWMLGPVGALLSVPLTMIVKIAASNTEDLQWIAVLLAPAWQPGGRRPSWMPALQRSPSGRPVPGLDEPPRIPVAAATPAEAQIEE